MVKLEMVTRVAAPIERCFDLARSVEVHLAGNTHFGETAVVTEGVSSGLLKLGDRVTWRAKHFWLWQTLTSEITAFERPAYFQDVMLRGAFRSMRHEHLFRAVSMEETEMTDVSEFAAPLGILGLLVERLVLRDYMDKLLLERNNVIREFAERQEWL